MPLKDEATDLQQANNAEKQERQTLSQKDSYEILGDDTNTERRFLDDIMLNQANNFSEEDLRSRVFEASQTIHKLQEDLL